MKHKLIALIASLMLLSPLAVQVPVYAVDVFQPCGSSTGGQADVCKDVNNQNPGTNPIIGTIKVIIDILSIAIGVAAFIIIIISGLRMILSSGDPKAVEQARSGILYALAGIAVALVAQAIVVFVLNKV